MAINKVSGIYCIENIDNGKKYIGYAGDIKRRFLEHGTDLKKNEHVNKYLQNSYNKHGKEKFNFYIIQELKNNPELLKLMEIYWIAYYDSFVDCGKGYNMTRGGDGGFISENVRKKLSETKIGKNNPNYGKILSAEHKQKISIANTGKIFSKNHIEHLKESRKSIVFTDRWKKNISDGIKSKNYSKKNGNYHNNGRAKLNESEVLIIKYMLYNNFLPKNILSIFNISRGTLSDIKLGKIWGEITLNNGFSFFDVTTKKNKKLNIDKVLEIRKLLHNGIGVMKISRMFDVSRETIRKIKNNITWKDVHYADERIDSSIGK